MMVRWIEIRRGTHHGGLRSWDVSVTFHESGYGVKNLQRQRPPERGGEGGGRTVGCVKERPGRFTKGKKLTWVGSRRSQNTASVASGGGRRPDRKLGGVVGHRGSRDAAGRIRGTSNIATVVNLLLRKVDDRNSGLTAVMLCGGRHGGGGRAGSSRHHSRILYFKS
jgi:hypothetical protein